MPVLVFPLSRIEGHAQVVIEVRDGAIVSTRLQATEFRGFEYLVRGVPAEQMIVIVPRICGVCSTAHHLAAVKTLEAIYGVAPPPLAQKLRELLMLGQIIQNQATSMFIFTMPDRLGVASIFQLAGDDDVDAGRSAIATRALQVRRAGTCLIELAGGQFIHPVKAVIGGVTAGVKRKAADGARRRVLEALPIACELFDTYWKMSVAMKGRLGTWGDDRPTCYIASVAERRPNYAGDRVRVLCPDGPESRSFDAGEFHSHLEWHESATSYAAKTTYRGQVMRANSLARVNMASAMGTDRADEYLERFRNAFGRPAHAIMLFDLARGIELVYALERASELLAEPLDGTETTVPYVPKDGEGYGLVEAPRGPLIHHYTIEDGLVSGAEFIIPTVHNIAAVEQALQVAAANHVSDRSIEIGLEAAVGRVVRAFDPCIACATH